MKFWDSILLITTVILIYEIRNARRFTPTANALCVSGFLKYLFIVQRAQKTGLDYYSNSL
ncbi:unnamed protein product [Heterobilharzia americana]|nr:unnamed protein product [Heterobilharzia americana]